MGARARVVLADGSEWVGRVTYLSGEVVGLRSEGPAAVQPRAGDTASVIVGVGESMVAAQARVLAASGSFLRLIRREAPEGGADRRRAVRVPVGGRADVEVTAPGGRRTTVEAEVVDMSASGCALRTDFELPMGDVVVIDLTVGASSFHLVGRVVRVWRNQDISGEHAGIQFDALDAETTARLNRFLLDRLRDVSNPARSADRPQTDR